MNHTRIAAAMIAGIATVFGSLGSAQESGAGAYQAAGERFRLVRVAAGLEYPWSMAFLPEGGVLVAERPGRLTVLESDGRTRRVEGLPPVAAAGQGGLLDIALHPDFVRSRLVYWTFAAPGPGGASTALARGRLEGGRLVGVQILWTMPKRSGSSAHFGSRVRFLPDGTLLLTTGDRGDQARARDYSDAAGKTIRLRDDGSVPSDNPFAGRPGALPEIYSIGHRNPQGLAVKDGRAWLSEHGPRGGDEINLIRAGADYGWPLATYGLAYSGARIAESPTAPGIEPPLLHWTPSIAPSGLDFYEGDVFRAWRDHLISGSLAGQKLVLLRVAGERVAGQETLVDGTVGRIRDVRVGPDGFVYLLTDERNGALWRLEPVKP